MTVPGELVERAREAWKHEGAIPGRFRFDLAMRAALVAVADDLRAEGAERAFAAVLAVAAEDTGAEATARVGLVGRTVAEARRRLDEERQR